MKFSNTFTLATLALFMIGSTDANLRGLRSLEDTDPDSQKCTASDQDPWASGSYVPCCAGLEEEQYKCTMLIPTPHNCPWTNPEIDTCNTKAWDYCGTQGCWAEFCYSSLQYDPTQTPPCPVIPDETPDWSSMQK